jgi:zinc transport system permease protein
MSEDMPGAAMLDDFFWRAVLAGVGVAIVAGPLGCFVVWRRLSYFGDTMSHAALLGVALAFLLQINVTLAVFAVALFVSVALLLLNRREALPSDALLGLLSHSSLALGIVVLSFMSWVRMDLTGLLFGDILAVSKTDLAVIYAGGIAILALLAWIWKPLLAATVSRELAAAEGMKPERNDFIFMMVTAAVVAIAMKVVGILLITALLIFPAAAARRVSHGPLQMAVIAAIAGVISAIGGLFGSLTWDSPAGPTMVVAALLLFVASISPLAGLVSRGRPIQGERS